MVEKDFLVSEINNRMVVDVTHVNDSYIYDIEVWGEKVNDCDIIGTPKFRYGENESDPQNPKNKILTNHK